MSKEERLNKRKRRKKLSIILVSIVIIYLTFRLFPALYASSSKTYTVKNGIIEISDRTLGIAIRDEEVYKSDSQGKITYLIDEGEKVGVGAKIAQISRDYDSKILKDELQEVDEKIEILKEKNISTMLFKNDLEKNNEIIEQIINEIQHCIIEGGYGKVDDLKVELTARIEKNSFISGGNGFIDQSIDSLLDRREEIITRIEENNRFYYSDRAGIISYKIDNLENIYTLDYALQIYPSDFKIIEINSKESNNNSDIIYGQPIFKILNNLNWYVVAKLEKNSINNIEEGKNVYIKFSNYDEVHEAVVRKINTKDSEFVVIFKLNSYCYKYYNNRYIDIEIIRDRYEGLKIPKTSIVKRNGINGVYVKNINNLLKFKPIEIIGENDNYVIVKEGIIQVNQDGVKKNMKSLVLFDEIIIDGTSIKE